MEFQPSSTIQSQIFASRNSHRRVKITKSISSSPVAKGIIDLETGEAVDAMEKEG